MAKGSGRRQVIAQTCCAASIWARPEALVRLFSPQHQPSLYSAVCCLIAASGSIDHCIIVVPRRLSGSLYGKDRGGRLFLDLYDLVRLVSAKTLTAETTYLLRPIAESNNIYSSHT